MEPGRPLRLQSNLCLDDYPQNSGWDFSNKVNRYYLFHGPAHGHRREVEIALAEVFLPSRYLNVSAERGWWEVHALSRRKWIPLARESVDPGFYGDPGKLATDVNNAIIKLLKKPNQEGTVSIEIGEQTHIAFSTGELAITLGLDLARLWGFAAERRMSAPPTHNFGRDDRYLLRAPYTGNVHSNKGALSVHCSSIEATMTGPRYTRTMQLVHWKPAEADEVTTSRHVVFPHPVYHRIVDRGLDHLSIRITDSADVPVEFFGENTTVCLWVRDRRSA